MRRLRDLLRTAALIAAILAIAAGAGWAQGSMTFRPIPADSAAALDDARAAARETGKRIRKVVREVNTADVPVTIRVGDDSIVVEPVSPPDVPAVPEIPEVARESTGEIIRFGSPIVVHAGQAVDGDVVSIGGSVRVEGVVNGSVTAMGGDVTLNPGSRVEGDVVCMGGTLRQEPGSSISGQLVTAPRVPGAGLFLPVLAVVGTGFKIIAHLMWILFVMAVAFLVVKLAPARTQAAVDHIRGDAGSSFLWGLLMIGLCIPGLVVLAIAVAILCITIIGIPLALAALLGYAAFIAIAMIWGSIVGYTLLGDHVFTRFKGSKPTLLRAALWGVAAVLGLRIVADILHVVPLFGFFGGLVRAIGIAASAVLATLGAGALVRGEYQRRTVQTWWQRSRFRRNNGSRADDFPPPPGSAYPPPPAAAYPPPPVPPAPGAASAAWPPSPPSEAPPAPPGPSAPPDPPAPAQ